MIEWSNGDYVMVNGTMVLNFHHPEKMGLAYFMYSVIGLPVAIFQVLAYIVMFVAASRYARMRANQPGGTNVSSAQLKLAITGFVSSIHLLLVMIFTTLASAGGQYFNIYYFIYKIVTDIFYQFNPYMLLACSSALRRALLNLLRRPTEKSNSTATNTQPSLPINVRSKPNSTVPVRF
uniref:G-protein coupled receptors family 1 profile domain-containing protein n=1 Tax=Plectus sambesii TaxID=2011161 RepID=A0A914UUY0_9BILA